MEVIHLSIYYSQWGLLFPVHSASKTVKQIGPKLSAILFETNTLLSFAGTINVQTAFHISVA